MSTLRVDTILGESGAERRGLMTYAIISDQKTQDTDGGTFSNGDWRTRDLNHKIADPDGIVTIPATEDRFTLQAGSYLIEAFAPSFGVNANMARLYNITDDEVTQYGSHSYSRSASGDLGDSKSFVHARVTISGATEFKIEHRCSTSRSNNGFGVGSNFGPETFTVVKIFKEA